ncbi:metal ABC transporter substrate-binding protein [Demequina sediminicola]|uniref:metal ABC transporter substrate-binding protein n=1 Tax=Demequina sediminicola TaxID=1095026 RepID=UPI0009E42492|nr:metal ABC transporter substrate-binding protein [Demequina sediminicola]
MTSPRILITGSLLGALALAGCSAADSETDSDTSAAANTSLTVGTAFYPLQYVAERIGGDLVAVETLISAGVEPHDAELSPKTVRDMQSMDTVLFLSDFQPAVDDAMETTGARGLDAHHIIDEHGAEEAEHEEESDHDDHDHDEETETTEEESSHDDHDHGSLDPHFWLDPTLLAEYADDVLAEFSELDPDNAETYSANASQLLTDLDAIDASYSDGLATCERRDIFVGHEAFGYLALAYDLTQEGLAGLDPEAEPSPARVREIRDMVEDTGATTIYSESEVSADAAEAVAEDVGVDVLVLSPIETVADDEDYLGVMESNLEALRTGLGCS